MTNKNNARLVTYVTEAEHEKLRLESARQRISVAAHLRKVVGDHVATLGGEMTNTETHMSMAMSHLRKVTSPVLGENRQRLQDYVDAIETELERIKKDRGLK